MLFLSSTALAQEFDANKGFNWLVDKSSNGNYGDIKTTAVAAVALKDSGVLSHADLALQYLRSQEDSNDNCWPKGSCNPQDTAFALWALSEFGEKTVAGQSWLRDSLTAALKNNWWLQVVTAENGTCSISYPTDKGTQEDIIRIDGGKFPGCSATPSGTFFDLNRCLKTKNTLVKHASATLDVNCKSLGTNTVISVIFNKGNEFTLVEQATAERYLVTINNGCFGSTAKGSCAKDVSLYNNWFLQEIESAVDVDSWLLSKYDNLKAFDNALMFLASEDDEQLFLDDLIKQQSNDGSFGKDVLDTSLAILALKKGGSSEEETAAIEFLESKQREDGSWEDSKFKTALALYSAFTSANIVLGPPKPRTGGGGDGPICGDNICEDDETEVSCPKDCKTQTQTCVVDGRCDANFGENSRNCASDCTCGDNVCDSVEKSGGSCTDDCGDSSGGSKAFCGDDLAEGVEECDGSDDAFCPGSCQVDCTCGVEEESSSLGWLWILLIILLLGIAAFFFYSKYQGKGGKRPTAKRPEYKPYSSQLQGPQKRAAPKMQYAAPKSSARASKVDDELEKSIKEAKKLLKKL
tara:strand:+ start:41868 stop:43604 length:1737 start_codon:yes stop_codon:yes gene_type:complete